jgi:3-hydroxybutyryl-CoA dehydrogenase
MGRRIAFQCARSGMPCRLHDVQPEALETARTQIRCWLEEKVGVGAAAEAMERVDLCSDLASCLDRVDLVIENVPEDLELKRKVFVELDRLAPAHALLATNSSSLPASRIATATSRPDRVFNVNFNNTTEDELLVELMAAEGLPPSVLEAGEEFLKAIATVPIVTRREIMGFSMNRVWRAIKRETLHLVGDGYSRFEDLDRAWILSFGTRLGPFGMMDEIGLDVIRDVERQYFNDSGEERDRPPAFLERMVAASRLGVKSGRGFYSYPNPEYEIEGWLEKKAPWSPDRAVDLEV